MGLQADMLGAGGSVDTEIRDTSVLKSHYGALKAAFLAQKTIQASTGRLSHIRGHDVVTGHVVQQTS